MNTLPRMLEDCGRARNLSGSQVQRKIRSSQTTFVMHGLSVLSGLSEASTDVSSLMIPEQFDAENHSALFPDRLFSVLARGFTSTTHWGPSSGSERSSPISRVSGGQGAPATSSHRLQDYRPGLKTRSPYRRRFAGRLLHRGRLSAGPTLSTAR